MHQDTAEGAYSDPPYFLDGFVWAYFLGEGELRVFLHSWNPKYATGSN